MKDHKTAMKPFRLTNMCLCFLAQLVGKQCSTSTREIYSLLNTWERKNTKDAYYRLCTPPAMLRTFRLAYAHFPCPPPNGLVSDQSQKLFTDNISGACDKISQQMLHNQI